MNLNSQSPSVSLIETKSEASQNVTIPACILNDYGTRAVKSSLSEIRYISFNCCKTLLQKPSVHFFRQLIQLSTSSVTFELSSALLLLLQSKPGR
jgi:hypothetical protein